MSVNVREIDQCMLALRGFCRKLQDATAIADTGGDVPVIADFPGATASGLATTAIITTLVNRYFAERQESDGRRSNVQPGPIT